MSPDRERHGPAYYADHAAQLGWGPDSRPDPAKLAYLEAEVRGRRVLDVACGPGIYAEALGRGGRDVVGVDFTRALLAAGRARFRDFRCACAAAYALPFRDASMDTVLLLSILEHGDDVALLREGARVARERIIVQVPLGEPALLSQAGLLYSHWSDRSHLRVYTAASLEELVTAAGCRLLSVSPAYPRDLTDLYLSALRVRRPVRALVRRILKPLRRHLVALPAECFAVIAPR